MKQSKARILELSEAVEYNRKVIWLELREMAGVMPVTFYVEQFPFLKFDAENRIAMITVRADYYGKTWRCWDRNPEGAESVKLWKSAGGEDQ